MDLKLKGKRALVMGASSGLGFAIAATLRDEGATVAICSRGGDKLKKAAAELGGALAIETDLSKPGAAKALVEQVVAKLGGVDILVTNTGGPPAAKFSDTTVDQWAQGFQGLWMSAVDAIAAALPGMRQRKWGRIMLITSIAAKEPLPGMTISNSLRAGLSGLTNSLSQEVAVDGITVNALLPGYTKTERLAELNVSDEKISANIPARRLGRPEELAALATFLASEQAGYVTGQAIACDGGFIRSI